MRTRDSSLNYNQKRWIARIIILFLYGFGTIILIGTISTHRKALASRNWPIVMGTVLEYSTHSDFNIIRYRYTWLAVDHESSRINYGFDEGEDQIGEIRVGQTINVFVNPSQPNECVLVPGLFGGKQFFYPVGTFFFLMGTGVLAGEIMERRSNRFNRRVVRTIR